MFDCLKKSFFWMFTDISNSVYLKLTSFLTDNDNIKSFFPSAFHIVMVVKHTQARKNIGILDFLFIHLTHSAICQSC